MKKLLTSTALILGLVAASMHDARAQAPERFSYQGVARDASGNILTNATVGLRLTIRAGSATGISVYQETHATSTNALGLISVEVGGGSGGSGFSSINWGSGSYYLQAELDPAGGTAYQNMGASQLLSVPYALYAASGGSGGGGSSLDGAYDFGGAGLGRTITADAGAVRIDGTDGIAVTGVLSSGADVEIGGGGTMMFFNPRRAAFRAGRSEAYETGYGWDSNYVGIGSVALGTGTVASGSASVALGYNGVATGAFSTALGNASLATGTNSISIGLNTTAPSFAEMVVGRFNSEYTPTIGGTAGWNTLDRLFVVGNGTNSTNRSNAIVVLKGGNTAIGNISPTSKLDIDGQVRIRGGAPGAGKVLTSDANGLASWQTASGGGSGWNLTGNSGTNGSTDFVGTTDNIPLNFRVNNQRAGRIATNNTSHGYQSFNSTATGINNAVFGNAAMQALTSGGGNAALGYRTLNATTTGSFNVAIGNNALQANTSGSDNIAIGSGSMLNNTVGVRNTAVGNNALLANVKGYSNVAIGVSSLRNDTAARNIVAIGDSALFNNRSNHPLQEFHTGIRNVAVGSKALFSNIQGSENTAVGFHAMRQANSNGNSAFGYLALSISTGTGNTAIGASTLPQATTGSSNVAVGGNALSYTVTGSHNTAVGNGAGPQPGGGSFSNTTTLGSGAIATASNQVRFGNSLTESIGGPGEWVNTSDGRFKKNVAESVAGLDFISKLRPVNYVLDWKEHDEFIRGEALHSEDQYRMLIQTVHSGFIAQEVEQAAKAIGFDFSGVDAPKNEGDVYGLRYAAFVVPLVKAVQEQQQIIEALQQQITELRATVETLSK